MAMITMFFVDSSFFSCLAASSINNSSFCVLARNGLALFQQKTPDLPIRGKILVRKKPAVFSHPDYTVGFGITPNRPQMRFADCTAGREFHPAPKNNLMCIYCLCNFYGLIIGR